MSVRLLILSDSHLYHSRDKELFGVNTYSALRTTANHIRKQQEHFDLMVALGDLSDDGSEQSYRDFHTLTQGLADSVIWVKGNHDKFTGIPIFEWESCLRNEWHRDSWHFIFLDTALPGRDEGRLAQKELERLSRFLASHSDGHILVFLHHQPVLVGSKFIDDLALANRDEFWKIMSAGTGIKAIIFGHVHQQVDQFYKGIRLISAPSTSVQFKPNSDQLDFDELKHGFRTFTLSPDGKLETSAVLVDPDRTNRR